MVGNEMNQGITSFPSTCEKPSTKPNGVGSNDGYLEESPTKHTTDNGLVGSKKSSTRSQVEEESEGLLHQLTINRTTSEHTIDSAINNTNENVNPLKDSMISNHKSLVLLEMKKAMRDTSISQKENQASTPEKSAMSSSEPTSTTSSSSYSRNFNKYSPIKPLPKNSTVEEQRCKGFKTPTKRKIIESLVDDMVKDAFHSLSSDDRSRETPQKCLKRGYDGSSIVTSIVEDVLDKAVCNLNEISEYKDKTETHLVPYTKNSNENESRNYFAWQALNPARSLETEALNSCYNPDSPQIIHADKSQELNLQQNNVQIVCDICCQMEPSNVFASETDLKTHTLKMHVNPLFISPSDLSEIGGISAINKANETKLTAVDLEKLQKDTISSVEKAGNKNNSLQSSTASVDFFWFRCHVCFLLFNAKHSLSAHLSKNHLVSHSQSNGVESIIAKGPYRKKGPGRPLKKYTVNSELDEKQTACKFNVSDIKTKKENADKSVEISSDNDETLPLSLKKKESKRRKNGNLVELSMRDEKDESATGKSRRCYSKNVIQPVQPSSSSSSGFNSFKIGRRGKNLTRAPEVINIESGDTIDLEESLHEIRKSEKNFDNFTIKTEQSKDFYPNSSSDSANFTEKTASSETNSENSKSLQLFEEKNNAWKREMYGNIPPAQELQDEFLEKMSSSNNLISSSLNGSSSSENLSPLLSSSTKSALSISSNDHPPAIVVQPSPPEKSKEDLAGKDIDSNSKKEITKSKSLISKPTLKHKQNRKNGQKKKRKVVKKLKGRNKKASRPLKVLKLAKKATLVAGMKERSHNNKSANNESKVSRHIPMRNYDNEKCFEVHKAVTETENSFVCLSCEKTFPGYLDLMAHKTICKPKKISKYTLMADTKLLNKAENQKHQPKYRILDGLVSKSERRFDLVQEDDELNEEFSDYYNSIQRLVPETTFNNMHGKIHHIESVDGGVWKSILEKKNPIQSNRNNQKYRKDEIKLNFSPWWTKDDVWGSSGWEVSSNIVGTLDSYGRVHLSWKAYETNERSYSIFLQHLSQLHWPEQSKFQNIFDKHLKTQAPKKNARQSSEHFSLDTENGKNFSGQANRRTSLPQSIGLKQLGRSIKYMTAAEKREIEKNKVKEAAKIKRANTIAAKKKLNLLTRQDKESNLDNPTSKEDIKTEGHLNGEWELDHDFMCSSCGEIFDELREVWHHKWDAHPRCLVMHVTLPRKFILPPHQLIHPQLGRQLTVEKGASNPPNPKTAPIKKRKGRRAANVVDSNDVSISAISNKATSYQCKKCFSEMNLSSVENVDNIQFKTKEEFYVHLLECGGDLEWRGKRDKKKKGSKKISNQTSQSKDPDALLKRRLLDKERKEKRAEMFNLPMQRLKSGRKTRLQIHLVKEERNKKRKETLERKKLEVAAIRDSRKQNTPMQKNSTKIIKQSKKQQIYEPRRSMRGTRALNILNSASNITVVDKSDINNHNDLVKDLESNLTIKRQESKITKEKESSLKINEHTGENLVKDEKNITPRSGNTTPSNDPKTELLKNVVTEMLHKVEKAAKVLDKARDLRLSVEENSNKCLSSTSYTKSKSLRSSLDSNINNSLITKQFKLGGIYKTVTSLSLIKVIAVTEVDVCEYIEDHTRLKSCISGATKSNEDNLETNCLTTSNEANNTGKSMRIAERAVKRGHTKSSFQKDVTEKFLMKTSEIKSRTEQSSCSPVESQPGTVLLNVMSASKGIEDTSNSKDEKISNTEDLDQSNYGSISDSDKVGSKNQRENAKMSSIVDKLFDDSKNSIQSKSSNKLQVPISCKTPDQARGNVTKSCRKCRQKVCRQMPACRMESERLCTSKKVVENSEKFKINTFENQKSSPYSSNTTESRTSINVTTSKHVIVEKENNSGSMSSSPRVIDSKTETDEDVPIISLKRSNSRKNKQSSSLDPKLVPTENENSIEDKNDNTKKETACPKPSNISTKTNVNQTPKNSKSPSSSSSDSVGSHRLRKGEMKQEHYISVQKDNLLFIEDKLRKTSDQNSKTVIMSTDKNLDIPVKNNIDEPLKCSEININEDHQQKRTSSPLHGCIVEGFQLIDNDSPRKRGRKPNMFYSEDDLLEITNVSGDDGILFLSLEDSPIANTTKKVPETKSSVPISIASHFKQKKADLGAIETLNKLDKSNTDSVKSQAYTYAPNSKDSSTGETKVVQKSKRGRKPKKSSTIANHKLEKVKHKINSVLDEKELRISDTLPNQKAGCVTVSMVTEVDKLRDSKETITDLEAKGIDAKKDDIEKETEDIYKGNLESDGGSLPFNGFDSCSESLATAEESTEDDERNDKKLDYVLVSSTVTPNNEQSGSVKMNGKDQDGNLKNGIQPALKLKLVIKNKYEQKMQIQNSMNKSSHENTLAGAIELKKRLLKERKRAKREREKARAMNRSDEINEESSKTKSKKVGPKRRSSFADSFYSNTGASVERRNAAKVCLEKMVASQEPLSDYIDETLNTNSTGNRNENKTVDDKVMHMEKQSESIGNVQSKSLSNSKVGNISRNRIKKRLKPKLLKNNILGLADESSTADSSDSERRMPSRRNASLNASVMISLSNYKTESRNISNSRSNSDSGNCSPKPSNVPSTASSEIPKFNLETSEIKLQPAENFRKVNVFETDDVDDDSNDSKDLVNEQGKKGEVVDDFAKDNTNQNQMTADKSYQYQYDLCAKKKSDDREMAKNPFVESRECSLERSLSVSPNDKSLTRPISRSGQTLSKGNRALNKEMSRRKATRRKSEVDYSSGSEKGRILFPREVKQDAIKLIYEGKSQSEVAKDLNCSLSTVASWWQRRHTLQKPTRFRNVSSKLSTKHHNSSGISLSPSSYDSSEKEGERNDILKENEIEELPFYDSDMETKLKPRKTTNFDGNSAIKNLKDRVVESFVRESEMSDPLPHGISNDRYNCSGKLEKLSHTDSGQNNSPFPLSSILTRRLSSMSNFSSTSSSFDETSSDDNGIADNEDDSGEIVKRKHQSSFKGTSKKRKGRVLNKRSTKKKPRYNNGPSSNSKKTDLSSSFVGVKNHQKNFKSIQKGIENILNSDVLFEEDKDKNKSNNKFPNDEDDEDSNDNYRLEIKKESESNGTCNKKKAKALINCFRSFAMKPK